MTILFLWDKSSLIGKITTQSEGAVVLGDFTPFGGYYKYADFFSRYEEAAGDQEFSEVDRLDKIIKNFGFHVTSKNKSTVRFIDGLQITSSGISFRWRMGSELIED